MLLIGLKQELKLFKTRRICNVTELFIQHYLKNISGNLVVPDELKDIL